MDTTGNRLIGEIKALQSAQIIHSAMIGAGLRELYLHGENDKANVLADGGMKGASVLMELAHELEERIRSGNGLSAAVGQMIAAGWINKLDEIEGE